MNKPCKVLSLLLALVLCMSLAACTTDQPAHKPTYPTVAFHAPDYTESVPENSTASVATDKLEDISVKTSLGEFTIPVYDGRPYVEINGNEPFFTETDMQKTGQKPFETYSKLDELGRCGQAYACICEELMPAENEKRGAIGQVKPAGWHTATYPEVISDRYLYNRCHLIGWQLAGENANEQNLITGTRYLNIEGMLPFENQIADYVRSNEKAKVLYRVTPCYTGDNLIADGLIMEARSADDKLQFCIFVYNVQPYIDIDYATGDSVQIDTFLPGIPDPAKPIQPREANDQSEPDNQIFDFVVNVNSKKAHDETCQYAQKLDNENKAFIEGTIQDVIDAGYELCGHCFGDYPSNK